MSGRERTYFQWWLAPAAVTLLLLAFNSPWYRLHYWEVFRRKQGVYGLFVEMNFAVWWSATIFLLSAALFYEVACGETRPRRRAYLLAFKA